MSSVEVDNPQLKLMVEVLKVLTLWCCEALISSADLLYYLMQTVLTVLPLQSDSPKTDVCEGLAVTAAVIKSLGFFLTEVHICGTHLVAIYLPLDKRLSKLFVFKKKGKHVALKCWLSNLPLSAVLYNSSAEVKHLFVTSPCSTSLHLRCCFSPLRGHCSWILSSAYFVYLSTC